MTAHGADESVSFESQIKPLFREMDRDEMSFAFDLWNIDEVRENAQEILERVRSGSMPCDGEWPAENISLFERWISSGMHA